MDPTKTPILSVYDGPGHRVPIIAIKGDKGETGDPGTVLDGQTMPPLPTQNQLATAVKKIWLAMGGTFAAFVLAFSAQGELTRDTYWGDVPPTTTKLGTVLDLGGGGGGGGSGITSNDVRAIVNAEVGSTNDVKTAVSKTQFIEWGGDPLFYPNYHGTADAADHSTKASLDDDGNSIIDTYLKKTSPVVCTNEYGGIESSIALYGDLNMQGGYQKVLLNSFDSIVLPGNNASQVVTGIVESASITNAGAIAYADNIATNLMTIIETNNCHKLFDGKTFARPSTARECNNLLAYVITEMGGNIDVGGLTPGSTPNAITLTANDGVVKKIRVIKNGVEYTMEIE